MGGEQAVRAEFDRWAADGKGEGMARGHADITAQLLDRVPLGPEDRVCDLGCGIGWTVHAVLERGCRRAAGIDLSPAMVARAAAAAGAAFAAASVTALPFRDGAFTHVVSVEACYYWAALDRALAEARRILPAGGTFATVIDLHADNPGSAGWTDALPMPVHRLSGAEWTGRLRAAGFARAEAFPVHDRRPVDPPEAFTPSRWFAAYDDYRAYREHGALGLLATA